MELKKVFPVATLLAAINATPAVALSPTSNIDLHIYLSGASTFDTLLVASAAQLCDSGTLDIYSDTGTSKPEGASFHAAACRVSQSKISTLSVPSLNVMIHKRSLGGSQWGVSPVATASAVAQMTIDSTNCGSSAGGTAVINGVNVPIWNCSALVTTDSIPDAGISSVEPAMLGNIPNLVPVASNYGTSAGDPGTFILTSTQLSELNVQTLSAVTYGIPVTLNLRNALQAAQGKTVGSDLVADMPSLTKAQIASIMSGAIYSWGNLKTRDPATGTAVGLDTLSSLTSNGIPTPSTPKVHVCRRASGSGTQAQLNAHFLGAGCSSVSMLPKADNTPWSAVTNASSFLHTLSPPGSAVHDNIKASDVDNCLNSLQNANIWAIGVQSLEYGNSNYRYIAIDGVAPTLKNVGLSKYWDWAANTIQWRFSAISGDKLAILNQVVEKISQPSAITARNATFNPRITGPDSAAGILALGTNGSPTYTANIPFNTANPVMMVTNRGIGGTSTPSSCRPGIIPSGRDTEI